MKKKCARKECGKSFLPTRPKQVYCSSQCRTYAFRKRLEANAATKKKAKPVPQKTADTPKKAAQNEGLSYLEKRRQQKLGFKD